MVERWLAVEIDPGVLRATDGSGSGKARDGGRHGEQNLAWAEQKAVIHSSHNLRSTKEVNGSFSLI